MRPVALVAVLALIFSACTESSSVAPEDSVFQEGPVAVEPDSLVCWLSPTEGSPGSLVLTESTEELGLISPLIGMHGHASAFGDVDGDGQADLFIGTFGDRDDDAYRVRGAGGPRSDQLLLLKDGYETSANLMDELGRTSGSALADLDGDGDNDLLLIRHSGFADSTVPSRLYENNGPMEEGPTLPLPDGFFGRTPAVADFDSDGLLDIYVSEDRYGETGGILLRNTGDLQFEDVTSDSGLSGVFALGATAADLNNDGTADLVTSRNVFVGGGDMTFEDVTPKGFIEEPAGGEDDPAGVAVGDLNRDGIPDLVIGQHNRSTVEFDNESPVRVFVGSLDDDRPQYEEVTSDAGVVSLPTLAPHVGLIDLDNDGWLDIVTSSSAENGTLPAIHMNLGTEKPTFDNPTGLGPQQYWVGAPVADVDRDGRLDIFALEWEPSLPSLMFMNESRTGHWLEVSIEGPGRGVGAVVTVTDGDQLVGRQEITVGGGYSSGHAAVVHFGLGDLNEATVRLDLPDGTSVDLGIVAADRHIRWPNGCS